MILSAIGVILLALVGYSAGVVLVARNREFYPSLLDLLVILTLWIVSFVARSQMAAHGWSVLAALALGVVVGLVLTLARFAVSDAPPPIPKSELPEHARESGGTAVPLTLLRRLWQSWSHFGAQLGAVQGRLLMGFFYFIFVTPFALGYKLASDPLHMKQRPTSTTWEPKETLDTTIIKAQEQG
ncbi:MAG: hypothetical protein H6664_07675 [Ardenticatenaceae bacterium]|nr:hypothetical protein [Ardenticatenaceae bacterium]MCB9004238.1 hypothetical protein [Ardenticatenaceae bacterium]